jgi:hypothetical protein
VRAIPGRFMGIKFNSLSTASVNAANAIRIVARTITEAAIGLFLIRDRILSDRVFF